MDQQQAKAAFASPASSKSAGRKISAGPASAKKRRLEAATPAPRSDDDDDHCPPPAPAPEPTTTPRGGGGGVKGEAVTASADETVFDEDFSALEEAYPDDDGGGDFQDEDPVGIGGGDDGNQDQDADEGGVNLAMKGRQQTD